MNSGNFEKWIQEKLIPNLPPRTVIVIDNASYHNIEVNRVPTSNTKVGEMKQTVGGRTEHFVSGFGTETRPVRNNKKTQFR